jgi:hypothetical protein
MPNPLFPYVWSYNNQTVDVLANDITEYVVNPSPKVIPVCGAGEFVDSTLWDDSQSVRTRYQITPSFLEDKGFYLDYATNKYRFGDYDGLYNNSTLLINDTSKTLRLSTNSGVPGGVSYFGVNGVLNSLEVTNSLTATTAGPVAAKFIKIDVGGTPYKIQLLDV